MTTTTEVLPTDLKSKFADWLWRKRGCPLWDAQRDWFEAEDVLKEDWAREQLLRNYEPVAIDLERWVRFHLGRHYLAVEAEAQPTNLKDHLSRISTQRGLARDTRATLLAVLDGSIDHGREHFPAHSNNGLEGLLERKDAPFYDLCYHTFSLHGGKVLSKGNPPAAGGNKPPPRIYQDGCAVAFEQPVKAISAALHLARVLSAHNEEDDRPWLERLHCRVAIGCDWGAAVRNLPNAYRGEIVIDQECWRGLGDAGPLISPAQELLLAAGVRIGPST